MVDFDSVVVAARARAVASVAYEQTRAALPPGSDAPALLDAARAVVAADTALTAASAGNADVAFYGLWLAGAFSMLLRACARAATEAPPCPTP